MSRLHRFVHPVVLASVCLLLAWIRPPPSGAFVLVHTALCFALLFLLEQLAPYEGRSTTDWSQAPGFVGMGLLAVVGGELSKPVNGAVGALVGAGLAPGEAPLVVQIALGLLAAELGFYGWHRLGHSWGPLWRVHAVHHLPERMNLAGYFYMHPLDALGFGIARTVPLLLLGLSPEAICFIAAGSMTQKLLAHSNLGGDLGPLKYVMGTSEMHRMHHSADPAEVGNYGIVLPIWDLVFGTLVLRPEGAPLRYGVPGSGGWPPGVLARLIQPFRGEGAPPPEG